MWELRRATAQHVREVLADPSPQTLEELDGEAIEDAGARFIGRIARHGGEAMIIAGRAIYVFGLVPVGYQRISIWTLATPAYYALGPAGIRFARSWVRSQQAKFPGATLLSTTNSTHPDMARWYAALGFTPRGVALRYGIEGGENVRRT